MHSSKPRLSIFEDPTKPIDLALLEQHRARARPTASQPTVIVSPELLQAMLDDEDSRPTRPRAAVRAFPSLVPVYPTMPSRDPRPILMILTTLVAIAAMFSVAFYG